MEKHLLDFNIYHFKYFGLLYNFRKKYILGYNCNKLPVNHLNFSELNIYEEKSRHRVFDGSTYILLNNYGEVIIELEENNFEFMIGGIEYKILGGKKYITTFPNYHDFYIKIVPNLKIYTNRSFRVDLINEMFRGTDAFMYNFDIIDKNNINLTEHKMIVYGGMCAKIADEEILIDKDTFINDCKIMINNFFENYNGSQFVVIKLLPDIDTFCNFMIGLIESDTIKIRKNNMSFLKTM